MTRSCVLDQFHSTWPSLPFISGYGHKWDMLQTQLPLATVSYQLLYFSSGLLFGCLCKFVLELTLRSSEIFDRMQFITELKFKFKTDGSLPGLENCLKKPRFCKKKLKSPNFKVFRLYFCAVLYRSYLVS